MKSMLAVLGFTFRERARKKSFILSTVIILLLVVLVMFIPNLIGKATKSGAGIPLGTTSPSFTLFIIDPDGVLSDQLAQSSKSILNDYHTLLQKPADENKLRDEIKSDENKALLVVELVNGSPAITYYVNKAGSGPDPSELSQFVRDGYARSLLVKNHVSPDVIQKALTQVPYKVTELNKSGTGSMLSGMFSSMAITILLFIFIYMYGYWVAMSIASEKTSRVMELLVTSTKPSRIVIGKSLAMGLLGLAQLALILLTAVTAYKAVYPKSFNLAGEILNFSNVKPLALCMAIVYFILGFSLYAMMNAVVGSMVSRAEDIQSAFLPISMISIISFYLAYSAMFIPESTFAAVVSIIPFTAPFSMPSRLMSASVPVYQIVLSVILLLASTVAMAMFSIRLYSSAVLHYGKKLKLSELVRMTKS